MRRCSILIIFLVCTGGHGAPAPLAAAGPGVFITGEEDSESTRGTGNPLILWAFMPRFNIQCPPLGMVSYNNYCPDSVHTSTKLC